MVARYIQFSDVKINIEIVQKLLQKLGGERANQLFLIPFLHHAVLPFSDGT